MIDATGEIQYLVDVPNIRFYGLLDYDGSTFSIDVALAPNRGTTIFPAARSQQGEAGPH